MSNFSEAVRQLRIAEAKCPICGAKNTTQEPQTIRIDIHNEAWCSECGYEWSFAKEDLTP